MEAGNTVLSGDHLHEGGAIHVRARRAGSRRDRGRGRGARSQGSCDHRSLGGGTDRGRRRRARGDDARPCRRDGQAGRAQDRRDAQGRGGQQDRCAQGRDVEGRGRPDAEACNGPDAQAGRPRRDLSSMASVAQARLRDAFARAGYTQETLSAALRVDEPVDAGAAGPNASRVAGTLGTLVRLFLAGESVPRAAAAEALDLEAALVAELLECEDEVAAPLAVDEWHGFYVAHDHEADVAFDHVAGISNATRTLAALTMRRTARRALDLGTGCGSQALLASRHAEHVVATDVTERALRVSRLNLQLNDVTNVELRQGSLFEPVAGERFDLIVSNPPFVVSPDTDLVFRDAGLEGDEISRLVVRGAAEHLEPGGFASMLICWAHAAAADWPERVRQ